MEDTFTVREAAKILGVTRRTVYNWIRDGRLQANRISERVTRIPAAEIDRLIAPAGARALPDPSTVMWDVDPRELDLERHARFIIARVLEAGRPEQVAWLLRTYPIDLMIEVAEDGRSLSHRAAVAWSLLLRTRRDRAA